MSLRAPRGRDRPTHATLSPLVAMGALDAIRGHVVVLDSTGTILYVNAAWRAFGERNGYLSPLSGVGDDYLAVCERAAARGDPDGARARDLIQELLEGIRDSATFEYACPSPQVPRWFVFRGARFEVEGETFLSITHDDITTRHLAEDELRASHDALRSFNLALSHDIRAPLRRIEQLSRTAEEEARTGDGAPGLLARIADEASHARLLATDLLDLSNVTDLALSHEEVDLSSIAHEVIRRCREGSPERRVEVTIQAGLTALADPRLVRLILSNLLTNAWKFTANAEHAAIVFEAHPDAAGRLVFSVHDNGIGFGESEASRLFRPFARMGNALGFEGTGIGLVIVRGAVERMGGRVWVDRSSRAGATFRFTLS